MSSKAKGALPLAGLRVLEFSHAVLGPACGMVLADLGAEVIKVERAPDGDDTRYLKGFGIGYFTYFNRNKKSLAVDIKSEQGYEAVCKLLESTDILIENFGPGTMQRLGFGYTDMAAQFPGLIYCSLKGFMPGPYENRMALDEVVQMMSGLAYMTGPPGQPLRAGASVVDIMTGVYGALAVLVALRERDQTGKGQLVGSALFETAAHIMGHHMAYAAISGEEVPPMPARVSAWAVYHQFEVADGESVFVGITSDKQWARFCEVFDRQDLLNNEDLRSNNDRIAARDWLLDDLRVMFASLSKAEVLEKCAEARLPFAPIARPEDLFTDQHLNHNGMLQDTQLPNGEFAKLPRMPFSLGAHETELRSQPPAVGQHTDELLQAAGYSTEQIEDMKRATIIA